MKKFYYFNNYSGIKKNIQAFTIFLFFCVLSFKTTAQCPPNIDFEEGTFNNWQCWTGNLVSPSQYTIFPSPPVVNRHEIIPAIPGGSVDPWGFFPINCPNGSGYSIKLGNDQGGGQLDGVSYSFTIPTTQNQFNLIYNYAAVLQDGQANHDSTNQPRLLIRVRNVTDDSIITCSSFPFIVGSVSGFLPSPLNPTVLYKDWAANSISLDGMAGKTIEIFFITTDCGFTAHFGYAYIDVNTECSSAFTGATYCPDDTSITVTAPFGYMGYRWWNINDPSTILGTSQTITFNPPPAPGTILEVEVTPFAGYGCIDIYRAYLWDTLTVISNAGPDRLSCQNAPVQLGIAGNTAWTYSWSPVTGLSDPNISNPIATPSVTTTYVLSVTNSGGGCLTTDSVEVKAAVLDNSIVRTGLTVYCLGDPQAAVLTVQPADSIQWYLNGVAIPGANGTQYNVVQTGTYHATVFSFQGCNLTTADEMITVHAQPVSGFTVNNTEQCFNSHQFDFTNTSTISSGTITYNWDLGDGNTSTAPNVTHTYAQFGTYVVRLIVTSDNGCQDSTLFTVIVNESPKAGFTINTTEQCFKGNEFIFTNTSSISTNELLYRWDMGDGTIVSSQDVIYSYTQPGTYRVNLFVMGNLNCTDTISYDVFVNPEPVAGFTINSAHQCNTNNQFVFTNSSTIQWGTLQYMWYLGDGTTATTRDVTHSYAGPGDYTVKMVTISDKGCTDSISFNVKVLPFAVADFYVEPTCINLRLPITNKTLNTSGTPLNFLWEFGNGQTSSQVNPVYSYPAPGTYTIKLSVNSNLCPQTISVKQLDVVIDAPLPGITYPVKMAVMSFREQLQARPIGNSVLWMPSTNLDNAMIYNPVFKGLTDQLYTIKLKTVTGCVTIDTQLVKARRKIEIYVPTSFTPNGDGLNDYLFPSVMGIVSINSFRVYNRWGKLLYQMQSDRPGWNGRINGQIQEMQTVVWMIEAVDVDGVIQKRQGTSILLR